MSTPLFEIRNLVVDVLTDLGPKTVIKGINLKVNCGEVHALMGRNGSGKTTLSHTLMGHPRYKVIEGDILMNGESLLGLSPEERARKRMFLAFQYPVAVPGVTVANFLRSSVRSVRGDELSAKDVREKIRSELQNLQIPESFMTRSLNDGFSGGEKKRLETLQMRLLDPQFAILDETDSGLDIDALRIVSENIDRLRGPEKGILLITHYQRMLDYVRPDFVHVMMDGRFVKSGDASLALELEKKGYDWISP